MTFISYAQNFEDVLLWRALKDIEHGFYVDVGAWHPDIDSVTRAFYDRGWHGINIEPLPEMHRRLAAARPRDITLPVALGAEPGIASFHLVHGSTGLSTLVPQIAAGLSETGARIETVAVQVETLAAVCRQHAPPAVHFLKIDVEGAERAVLAGADFTQIRPWIVVVESTVPQSTIDTSSAWEHILLDARYRFAWFDGLNRFYIAAEKFDALNGAFLTPPNVFDDFVRAADTMVARKMGEMAQHVTVLEQHLAAAQADAARARAQAEAAWAQKEAAKAQAAKFGLLSDIRHRDLADRNQALAAAAAHAQRAEQALDLMRRSTSWRATAPLRRLASRLRKEPEPPAVRQSESAPSGAILVPRRAAAARVRTIHQFHSGSAPGDAITNAMFLTQGILRDLGYVSEIFVEHRAPSLAGRCRLIDELPERSDYILIVRHSFGFDAFERISALPARKILLYHNITPSHLFANSPVQQHYAELGRMQLKHWQPLVAASLADSDYNALELRGLGFDPVETCALLLDIPKLLENARPREPRAAPGVFTILFVGRITPSKGQDDLIAAYAEFRRQFTAPSQLVLVGSVAPGNEQYAGDLDAQIAALGLTSSVILTGQISDEERDGWYGAADLYVSLSQHEGFGVPLVEAMAHRVPVVAWPAGSVPYTLGKAGVLLADRAPESVAGVMLALANDPAGRNRLIELQLRRLEDFMPERHIPALLRALVLAGAAPPIDKRTRRALIENARFTIAGHVNGSYSLASINRAMMLAIEAARPGSVRALPVEGGMTEYVARVPEPLRETIARLVARPSVTGPEIVISQHYPVYVPEMRGDVTLAMFFWEESVVPAATIALMNASFHGVVAPSRFVAKVLIDSGLCIPVRTITPALDLAPLRKLAQERAQPRDVFAFFHISSGFPRKGIDVLIAAFLSEFTRDDSVRLVIKCFQNRHADVPQQVERWRAEYPNGAEIDVIDRDMTEQELLACFRDADALVLPTRGEGFNVPAAEAMAAGLPVIVTAATGHMDFCTEHNARLIGFRFAPSRTHLATAHSVWVEPDVAELAAAMRELYEARNAGALANRVAARTRQACADIDRFLDPARTVNQMTEAAIDMLLAPPPPPAEIAVITSWNVRCGVAEYSRQLVEALPEADSVAAVTIFPDTRSEAPGRLGKLQILPGVWRPGDAGSFEKLARAIAARDPGIVIIQHQPGLIGWEHLAGLLRTFAEQKRVVVVTLHAARHLAALQDDQRSDAVAALGRAARIIVHTVSDLNFMKELGLVQNVVFIPQGAPPGMPGTPPRAISADAAPVVGCYGFFLPGKGIPQLIDAFARLRHTWPKAKLRLVNAEYGIPESAAEIETCRKAADEAGLSGAIEWHTDFLKGEESLRLLAGCDVIALPYQASAESSSAALRTALGAAVPVMATPLRLFDEAENAVARFDGFDGPAIAAGLSGLLADREARAALQQQAQAWLADRAWSRIAERTLGMLLGLTRNAAECQPRGACAAPNMRIAEPSTCA